MYQYRQSEVQIYHNAKAKIYPDGTEKITYCSKPIFRESGWELAEPYQGLKLKQSKPKNMDNEPRDDNVRRAKNKVFDIALINPFTYFITLTFDQQHVDRYSVEETKACIQRFFNNLACWHDCIYLLIPELHKDSAIHAHGLISGNIKLMDSGKQTKDGKPIFNMPQWLYGFSTAIELTGESLNVARYITKYISKDFRKVYGSFYFAGGKGLKRSPPVKLYDKSYEQINVQEYYNQGAKLGFKYQTIEPNGGKEQSHDESN